jgi:hypothetical protein
MTNLLSRLTKAEQTRLLEDLNYMNLEEIRGFCSAHGIPYRIVAEHADGSVKATKDTDRRRSCSRVSGAISRRGASARPRASLRASFVTSTHLRGSDLVTVSTIAGTRRSSRK